MRYAVYSTAAEGTGLAGTAAEWLGRNAFDGFSLRQPDLSWLDAEALSALTADPRRYGFHGTLKAPFTPLESVDRADLHRLLDQVASETAPIDRPEGLAVSRLGPFFALVPAVPSQALNALAGRCVTEFEPFRAPLTEADLERRRRAGLTPQQDANLVRWGYPYVFDAFRFHMTLTGVVPYGLQVPMEMELKTRFAPFTDRPTRIDTLALFVQSARDEPFVVERTVTLAGAGMAAGSRS
ncbi:MAG: DUF1045 domain-containing protein [Pseudomonadota bacterium]